jgi:hypothetical protein
MDKITICLNGKLKEGDLVVAAPCSDYKSLIGRVIGIYYVGTSEHDEMTDNFTDDVLVDFNNNYSNKRITEIEKQFRNLYDDDEKTFDDIAIDSVIMAPSELLRIDPEKLGEGYYTSILDSETRTVEWCFNEYLKFINSQSKSTVYTTIISSRINGTGNNEEKEFNTECSAYEYACEQYSIMIDVFKERQNAWHEVAIRDVNGFTACGGEHGTNPSECYCIIMSCNRGLKTVK